MTKFLATLAAGAMLANTALAGNYETPAIIDVPPAAEDTAWSGFYLGAVAGTSLGTNYWAETSQNEEATPGNWDGTPIGFTVGYNHQLANGLIIGGEGDYSAGDILAVSTDGAIFGCGPGCETSLSGFATVRARVGYAKGSFLVFGTAGMAFSQAMATSDSIPNTTLGEGAVSGLVWGLGAEYAINPAWSVKGEFLSADMGQLDIPTLFCSVNCFTDISYQTIRLGVNYHF